MNRSNMYKNEPSIGAIAVVLFCFGISVFIAFRFFTG
jgi:hypothetical protein